MDRPMTLAFVLQLLKHAVAGGDDNIPLIWTASFMLADDDETGEDTYVLGEINCSCVGFTSELDMGIQEMVAEEAIKRVEEKHA